MANYYDNSRSLERSKRRTNLQSRNSFRPVSNLFDYHHPADVHRSSSGRQTAASSASAAPYYLDLLYPPSHHDSLHRRPYIAANQQNYSRQLSFTTQPIINPAFLDGTVKPVVFTDHQGYLRDEYNRYVTREQPTYGTTKTTTSMSGSGDERFDDRGSVNHQHPQSSTTTTTASVPHFPHLTKNVASQLARIGTASSSYNRHSFPVANDTNGHGHHYDLSHLTLPVENHYSNSSVDSSTTLVSGSTDFHVYPRAASEMSSSTAAIASLSSSLYYVDCTGNGPTGHPAQSSSASNGPGSLSSNRSSICSNSTLTQSSIGSYGGTSTDHELDPEPLPPPPPELRIGEPERLDSLPFPPPPPSRPLSPALSPSPLPPPPPPPVSIVSLKKRTTSPSPMNSNSNNRYSFPMSSFGSLPRRPAPPPPPVRSTPGTTSSLSVSPSPSSSSSGVSDATSTRSACSASTSSSISAPYSLSSTSYISSASSSCSTTGSGGGGSHYDQANVMPRNNSRVTSNAGSLISPDYSNLLVNMASTTSGLQDPSANPPIADHPSSINPPSNPHAHPAGHPNTNSHKRAPSSTLISFDPRKSTSPTYGWVYQSPNKMATTSSEENLASSSTNQTTILDTFNYAHGTSTMDRNNNNGPGPSSSSGYKTELREPESDDDTKMRAKSYTLFLDDPSEQSKEHIEMTSATTHGGGSISPSDQLLVAGAKRKQRCAPCITCTRVVVCSVAVVLFFTMLSIIGFTLYHRSQFGDDDGLAFWKEFFPLKHEPRNTTMQGNFTVNPAGAVTTIRPPDVSTAGDAVPIGAGEVTTLRTTTISGDLASDSSTEGPVKTLKPDLGSPTTLKPTTSTENPVTQTLKPDLLSSTTQKPTKNLATINSEVLSSSTASPVTQNSPYPPTPIPPPSTLAPSTTSIPTTTTSVPVTSPVPAAPTTTTTHPVVPKSTTTTTQTPTTVAPTTTAAPQSIPSKQPKLAETNESIPTTTTPASPSPTPSNLTQLPSSSTESSRFVDPVEVLDDHHHHHGTSSTPLITTSSPVTTTTVQPTTKLTSSAPNLTTTTVSPSSTTVTDILNGFIVNHTTAKANVTEISDSRDARQLKAITDVVAPPSDSNSNNSSETSKNSENSEFEASKPTTSAPVAPETTTPQIEPIQLESMSLETVTITLPLENSTFSPESITSIPDVTENVTRPEVSETTTKLPDVAPESQFTSTPTTTTVPGIALESVSKSTKNIAESTSVKPVPELVTESPKNSLDSILVKEIVKSALKPVQKSPNSLVNASDSVPESKNILESTKNSSESVLPVPESTTISPINVTQSASSANSTLSSPKPLENIPTVDPKSSTTTNSTTSLGNRFLKKVSEGFSKLKSNLSARFRSSKTSPMMMTTTTESPVTEKVQIEKLPEPVELDSGKRI